MADGESLPGLVIHAQSGLFDVETEIGILTSQIRGRLKEARRDTDLVALGDRVLVRPLADGTGLIEQVEPRQRVLSRRAPVGEREQVIVANPDQALLIFACADPPLNRRMLDRMLVAAEREDLPARICLNKVDLDEAGACSAAVEVYRTIGYPVHLTSAKTGQGVAELRQALQDRISVFAGPSGVGKSSLLNAIQPGLALRTAEVRQHTRKGAHTTVDLKLVRLEAGGYIADTPGMKAFALWDIEPEELDAYFPEIRDRVAGCAFSDCTHLHEPGCAVLAAVEAGELDAGRYDSYRRMRLGEKE